MQLDETVLKRARLRARAELARVDAGRAAAITARLAEILVEQDAPNFLPGIRSMHDLVTGPDPAAGLAEAYRVNIGMNGGMGSINDLVFWPADHHERKDVNEEWWALRDELWDLLARHG